MSSKIIIISTLLLLLIGFSILFVVEAQNHNFDYNKNWVAVYFENPGSDSLEFAIENHQGEKIAYGYKIILDEDKISESAIEIEAGATQKITPTLDQNMLNGAKTITIIVNSGDTEYQIYKKIQ